MLDTIQGESEVSNKLITKFVKGLATDKIIWGLTFLILAGIIGIIVYAAMNPGQSIFSVPSIAIPDLSASSPTPTRSPSPSPR